MNPPFLPLISPMLRQMHSLGRPPGRDWAAVNFEKSGMFTNQPTNQPWSLDWREHLQENMLLLFPWNMGCSFPFSLESIQEYFIMGPISCGKKTYINPHLVDMVETWLRYGWDLEDQPAIYGDVIGQDHGISWEYFSHLTWFPWLVLWNMAFMTFHSVGKLIFFREVQTTSQ